MEESTSAIAQENSTVPLEDVCIQLTEEELRQSLKRADRRRAGPARLWVQTILLALLAAYCIAAFFLSGAVSYGSLGIGLAAVVLGVAMWVVPDLHGRYIAHIEFTKNKCMRVRLYEEEIGFGDDDVFESVAYDACFAQTYDDMILLHFQGGYMVMLPRRVFSEDRWLWLQQRLQKPQTTTKGDGAHAEPGSTESGDDR